MLLYCPPAVPLPMSCDGWQRARKSGRRRPVKGFVISTTASITTQLIRQHHSWWMTPVCVQGQQDGWEYRIRNFLSMLRASIAGIAKQTAQQEWAGYNRSQADSNSRVSCSWSAHCGTKALPLLSPAHACVQPCVLRIPVMPTVSECCFLSSSSSMTRAARIMHSQLYSTARLLGMVCSGVLG